MLRSLRILCFVASLWGVCFCLGRAAEPSDSRPVAPGGAARADASDALAWCRDYAAAMKAAKQQAAMLVIYFFQPGEQQRPDRFQREVLEAPDIAERLAKVVLVKVPWHAEIRLGGEPMVLLDHASFAEMQGLPGLAMVDFAHSDAPYYGSVVSTFPFLGGRPYTADEMGVILDLPPGTLTQRTLIYAVRVHPEHPASTDGELHPALVEEAEAHCRYQARVQRQGHQQWESRFRRISALLPGGLTAQEVCAESWPGQGLLEAAIECVRCWRLSSGHWEAVRARHPFYGYDMKRGSNGVWYATGLFAAHPDRGRG